LPPRTRPGRQALRQEDDRLRRGERSEETRCVPTDGKALCTVDEPWEPMLVAPPTAASSHLSDGELFTTGMPDQVKHLADCAWCSHRLEVARAVAADEAGDDQDFEQALHSGQWQDEFNRASREAVLPDQARVLMTAPASVGDVEPGQIWRLTWRDRHLLVAVIEVADWQVLSAPVTTDVGLADELTLLVEAAQSPLATGLAVWVRSRAAVPLFVFDRPLGTLPHIGSAHLSARLALQQLTRAHLTGSAPPGNLPIGTSLSENDVDRLAMYDALWEQADWFVAAGAGLIDSSGVVITAQELRRTEQHSARPLSDVLCDSGLSLRQLAAQTGINMGRLLDLARVGATATPEEIGAIEEATKEEVAANNADQQFKAVTALTEVSRPTWRKARQRWTQDKRHGADLEDPAALVTHLLEHPVAARSIHREGEPADEHQRLRQYWRERVTMILGEYK